MKRPGLVFATVLWILVLIAACANGCATPDHVTLDARWRPLRRVQQDDLIPQGYTTLGSVVHAADLAEYLARTDDERTGLLLHEQYHAQREAEIGLVGFLIAYAADPRFRWAEESVGWKLELVWCVKRRIGVDVPWIARVLSERYAGMISFEAALAWVAAVVTEASGS